MPHGLWFISRTNGSGQTTTLYSLLHEINTNKVNISTLEDPVEYQIAGVNQVQVNPQAGLTFSSGLRAFLRQDPKQMDFAYFFTQLIRLFISCLMGMAMAQPWMTRYKGDRVVNERGHL